MLHSNQKKSNFNLSSPWKLSIQSVEERHQSPEST